MFTMKKLAIGQKLKYVRPRANILKNLGEYE